MSRIYLIGYMGAGKSTVGRLLAQRVGCHFVDIDEIIRDRCGMEISSVFRDYGEEAFREIERDVIDSSRLLLQTVIATGGGAPTYRDNMTKMNESGTTIYLDITPSALAERLIHEREVRPILADLSDVELLSFITKHIDQRRQYYEMAHTTIPADQPIDTVINDILTYLPTKKP